MLVYLCVCIPLCVCTYIHICACVNNQIRLHVNFSACVDVSLSYVHVYKYVLQMALGSCARPAWKINPPLLLLPFGYVSTCACVCLCVWLCPSLCAPPCQHLGVCMSVRFASLALAWYNLQMYCSAAFRELQVPCQICAV